MEIFFVVRLTLKSLSLFLSLVEITIVIDDRYYPLSSSFSIDLLRSKSSLDGDILYHRRSSYTRTHPVPPTRLFVVSHFVVNDRLAARGSRRGRFNALETKHPYPLFFKRFRRCLPAAGRIRARKNGPFIPVENLGIFAPAGNERNRTFDTRPGRNWLRYTYRYFLRRPRDVSVMFQRYIRPYALYPNHFLVSLSICDLFLKSFDCFYFNNCYFRRSKCVENLWINIT